MRSRLSPQARRVLEEIADGQTWDDLLSEFSYLNFTDLADSLWEAFEFARLSRQFSQEDCRILKGLAMGYGFETVARKLKISIFDIQQFAEAISDLDRRLGQEPKKSNRRKRRSRGKRSRRKKTSEYKNESWTTYEEHLLVRLKKEGYNSRIISLVLKKNQNIIEARLEKLDLIN